MLAKSLFEHYRRNLYRNVAGGSGIPVIYRSTPPAGSPVPIDVPMHAAETTAMVLLVDDNWVGDREWVEWGKRQSKAADATGMNILVFPVAITEQAIKAVPEQAHQWFKDDKTPEAKVRWLLATLSYDCCRTLRQYLEKLRRPTVPDGELEAFLKPVEVFLSHSKHDPHGVAIAKKLRSFLYDAGYHTFFDVHDIPVGRHFDRVLLLKVKKSAVVAVHTDSYSSREWCRREMIQAKKNDVPVVVADCIADIDERGFPYMANVPIVRMDPKKKNRIDVIVARLIDEVLKDFLWKCRVQLFEAGVGPNVAFVPRPPELIVLTALKERTPVKDVLVYPDPPIGAEELELFSTAAPGVRLLSATEFLAGTAP